MKKKKKKSQTQANALRGKHVAVGLQLTFAILLSLESCPSNF